eukprot:CAMPEP_0181262052 /NCGR_PEP_ID=MMETSP1097-20121128/1824_1 /TAXON_ID=35684 /ORGANISM="Pseudopedinella elastica, Strain CCMP716" /LENGTH=47 /DNA_ID= /DNA_START= /DNA_END= /DNA_ORIENTATION=
MTAAVSSSCSADFDVPSWPICETPFTRLPPRFALSDIKPAFTSLVLA